MGGFHHSFEAYSVAHPPAISRPSEQDKNTPAYAAFRFALRLSG